MQRAKIGDTKLEITGSRNERWLLTGGCGFVGRNFADYLIKMGVVPGNIRVIDNLSVCGLSELEGTVGHVERGGDWGGNAVSFYEADIREASSLTTPLSGATHIIHLAACTGIVPSIEDPLFDCGQNVIGTLNVLEYCRNNAVDAFVLASSGAPLGAVTPPIREDLPANPASPYGASKLAGEGYCQAYANCFGVNTVVLRFGNLYGPFSSHKESIVAKFISRAFAGEELEIYGDGSASRDFIYSADLCDAIFKSAQKASSAKGEIFQIATHRETTVMELTEMLVEVLKTRGLKNISVKCIDPRFGDVQRNFADVSKAKRMLDWSPTHTLKEGLQETVDWFEKTHDLAS